MSATTTAPKLPLEIINGTIDSFEPNEIKEIVRQNVRMIILTNPGERIMLPDFGVGPLTYLFEQSISDTFIQLELAIKDQLAKYIPAIDVLQVLVEPLNDEQRLNIKVSYEIDFLRAKDQLELLIEY
tara:strand:- start:1050 stop:1430 length:381 start_codon:yes stop_codon:yes gene_type:complete